MAHRPHGSPSSQHSPPVLVPLPTDRSPAFIQSLMRAASESASHTGATATTQQQQQQQLYHVESSRLYHQPPPGATIVSSSTPAYAPRRSSNASVTEAPRIKHNQPLPHLPVIRLVEQETTAATTTPVQGGATVVSGGIIGPHDNTSNNNSNHQSNTPPLPPRIQAPSSSSSSSSSLSEKPLPPMPTTETSTSSSSSSSSSSATTNDINNPPSTLPYLQQQHQQQQHIAGASPLVSTTISFAHGEQYHSGGGGGGNNGNANNTNGSRQSLDHAPPPYSFMPGNRGSTIISTGPPPPTEDQLFQIQELSPGPLAVLSSSSTSSLGSGSSTLSAITAHSTNQSTQYICADPMHDQQYLLVGSSNALHSIDLTYSNHLQQQQQQLQERHQGGDSSNNNTSGRVGPAGGAVIGNVVRTHIQGVAFKEIHCLEEIGLVVVIAGRNSRVRCYDYDSINRLVAYGHSAQGRGRVVEGGKYGAMKNMIQLKVETALQRADDSNPSDGLYSSPPSGMQGTSFNRGVRGTAGSTATAPGGGALPQPLQQQQQHKPLPQNRHQHTTSLDRSSMLSPPAWSDNSSNSSGGSPGQPLESIRDDQETSSSCATTTTTTTTTTPPVTATSNFKKHKQRPLSLGGLASLAQEHVMRKSMPKDNHQPDAAYSSNSNSNNNKIPSTTVGTTTNTSNSTPSSPSSAIPGVTIGGSSSINSNIGAHPTKNKRLSQMASYLSQAAVNSNMAAHITNNPQDAASEAVGWAWDFTKLKQTKDVLGLDFHYTTTTVFMTVVSKNAIDIYCRPRSTRGRKPPNGAGAGGNNNSGNGSRTSHSGADTPGRSNISSVGGGGGMAMAGTTSPESSSSHFHRDYSQDPYEWKPYKQLYHPEAPSFMTVVKGPTEVTDIILGKGSRACVINVHDMSVTDLHRQETSSVIHGLSKKLGFRNSSLWHSFVKIPFDVPPHILFPAAAEAMYGSGSSCSERKGASHSRPLSVYNGGTGSSGYPSSAVASGGGPQRQSRDNILQRPADQLSIHQQEMNEQERDEAARGLALKLQNVQLQNINNNNNNNNNNNHLGVPYHPTHYRGSSSSSSPPSSPSSSNSSSSIVLPSQLPSSTTTATTPAQPVQATKTKTRMVTSDEVLNLAFSQRTTGQLFLATYGSQSRIVDLQGKPQSRVVLDWGESSGSGVVGCPPQKVEFLKTMYDIYVVGFEKSAIVVFSLTRAKKVKEITKGDLIQATARAQSSASSVSVPGGGNSHQYRSHSPQPPPPGQNVATSPPSGPTNTSSSLAATALALTNATSTYTSGSSASIKFLGRDSMAEDSLGLFFSYCHPKNGVSICQLSVVPLLAPDELELIGYYP